MMKDQLLVWASILLVWGALTAAFVPTSVRPTKMKTELDMIASRRDVLASILLGTGATLMPIKGASAFSQQLDDYAYEPQQQFTDGRLDLNAAFVGDYKELRGMFPNAAGKIASHGPYEKVADIYKIPNLTARDKELFKKYEKYFTVNPPSRVFDERINARVST